MNRFITQEHYQICIIVQPQTESCIYLFVQFPNVQQRGCYHWILDACYERQPREHTCSVRTRVHSILNCCLGYSKMLRLFPLLVPIPRFRPSSCMLTYTISISACHPGLCHPEVKMLELHQRKECTGGPTEAAETDDE